MRALHGALQVDTQSGHDHGSAKGLRTCRHPCFTLKMWACILGHSHRGTITHLQPNAGPPCLVTHICSRVSVVAHICSPTQGRLAWCLRTSITGPAGTDHSKGNMTCLCPRENHKATSATTYRPAQAENKLDSTCQLLVEGPGGKSASGALSSPAAAIGHLSQQSSYKSPAARYRKVRNKQYAGKKAHRTTSRSLDKKYHPSHRWLGSNPLRSQPMRAGNRPGSRRRS